MSDAIKSTIQEISKKMESLIGATNVDLNTTNEVSIIVKKER